MAWLAELRKESPEGHRYTFLTTNGLENIRTAMDAGTWNLERHKLLNNVHIGIRKIVKQAAKAAPSVLDGDKKSGVHLQACRRAATTEWSKHATPQTLKELMAHSDIATTIAYYGGSRDEQKSKARTATANAAAGTMAAVASLRVVGA